MNFKQHFYFCHHCKSTLSKLDELYFVTEKPETGFCSETCIENFYAPVVKELENIESNLRLQLNIAPESTATQALCDSNLLLERALTSPTEVWEKKNELNEKVYSFIYKPQDGKAYLIILCTIFDRRPSFILLVTATTDLKLLNEFRFGNKIEKPEAVFDLKNASEENTKNVELDAETIESLESKKSQLLADILTIRSDFDIAFETFNLYDSYMLPTLETPDEIYEVNDREGDQVFAYIKAHPISGLPGPFPGEQVSFYYIVIAMQIDLKDMGSPDHADFIPILGIPTLDPKLYAYFKRGESVSSPLKN